MRFLFLWWGLLGSLTGFCQTSPVHAQPALTYRQLHHLVLFTRLAGSIRYFYPSQATSQADWQAFYADAIPRVLQAPTQEAFVDTLRRTLTAVAPYVLIQRPGGGPPIFAAAGAGPAYRWEHHSLNQDKQGLGIATILMRLAQLPFASRLVLANPAASSLPSTYALPLGDAWVATVPLVLPAAQANTPVSFRQRTHSFQVSQPAQRLALVMQTWNVLQQFYPYRAQLLRADWLAALPAALLAANDAQADQALLVACQRLAARLGDRHVQVARPTRTGLYITPPDFALAFELLPDGSTVVARAQGKWAAMFPLGSTLEQVNGQPVKQVLDSLQRQTSAVPGAVTRQLVVHQLVRYFWPHPAKLHLAVRSAGLLRSHAVALRQLRLPPSRAGAVRPLPGNLVYLDASRLRYTDFVRQLPLLQRAHGLIVDLRQRPAYGMQAALAHWAAEPLQSGWFATPVLHAPDFAVATYDSVRSVALPRSPHVATRTIFLIGPDTFSYGETLVELIRHYHLGLLLGQATGGTNGEMNFVSIGRHFRLSWTGRRVCNRDGQPYQRQGIRPAIEVQPTLAAIQQQRDAALQRAIAYLTTDKL